MATTNFHQNSFQTTDHIKNIGALDSISALTLLDNPEISSCKKLSIQIEIKVNQTIAEYILKKPSSLEINDISEGLTLFKESFKRDLKDLQIVEIFFGRACKFLKGFYRIDDDCEIVHVPEDSVQIFEDLDLLKEKVSEKFRAEYENFRSKLVFPEPAPKFVSIFDCFHKKRRIYRREKQHYKVSVYIAVNSETNEKIAIKEYSNVNHVIEKIVLEEIKFLKRVSEIANSNNCCIKVFDTRMYESTIEIAMEYHPQNLVTYINHLNTNDLKLTEDELLKIIIMIIDGFSYLEEYHIHHGDIKPQNLLMSSEGHIKIIDFNVAFESVQETSNCRRIKGTPQYFAPELAKMWDSGIRFGKYSRRKADVFSAGLTILNLACLEELEDLNREASHPKLMLKVERIEYSNTIKALLRNMLALEPAVRKRFKFLKSFLDDGGTCQTIH